MKDLSSCTVCFICGDIPSRNNYEHESLDSSEGDKIASSSKWKEECAVVLSGLLCASGRSSKDTREVLETARYCSKCDVIVKDLCWSFQMMDNLRNHMAGLVEKTVKNIFRHHEKLEKQSSKKRVTGSTKLLKEALKNTVQDLEDSGWQSRNQEEIRSCLFYNLADIEFPQNLKRNQIGKLQHKKEVSFKVSPSKTNEDKKCQNEDTDTGEKVEVKCEPTDEIEYYEDDEDYEYGEEDSSFVPEVESASINNEDDIAFSGDEDDCNDDPLNDQEFVPSENEADEDDDEDWGERLSKRKRWSRSAVSYAEDEEEDELSESRDKKVTKNKKKKSSQPGSSGRKYLGKDEIQRRSKIFRAERPLPCPKCKHRFANEILRDGHIEKIHKGNPKPFKCTRCDKCFRKFLFLEAHIAVEHEGKKRLCKYRTYKCDVCSELFYTQERLELHIGSKHPKVQLDHSCEVCGKRFQSEEEVTGHKERTHMGEKPFKCEDCGEVFSNSVNLRTHVKNDHPVDESAFCKICNKTVTSWAHLKIHNRKNHPELCGKKYECQYCKITFKTYHMMRHHIRREHDKSEYCCETCGKKFNTAIRLKDHTRKHTGEKPYNCKVCKKTFRTVNDLKLHEQTHSGVRIMCDCCGNTYINNGSWRRHKARERAKAANGGSAAAISRKPRRIRKPKMSNSNSNNEAAAVADNQQDCEPFEPDNIPVLPDPAYQFAPVQGNFEQPQDLSVGIDNS